MILNNELQIDAPIARVWKLFDELESVLPCMPGAVYLGRNGDDELVAMKLKVGAITTNFEGTVRFVERDEPAYRVVIRGAGKDKGGKASASATIEAQLDAVSATKTRVSVKTDLALTGKLAQFGGGMIADISRSLIDQFAANLHQAVAKTSEDEPEASQNVAPSPPIASNLPAPETVAARAPAQPAKAPFTTDRAPLDVGGFVGAWMWRQAVRFVVIPGGMFALGWFCAKTFP